MLLTIIHIIVTAIGVIGIPYLIAKGKIRPGISLIESLKFEIILEMHKLRSQGKKYCHIYKMRDTIFQKRKSRKDKAPPLEYLLQFDQALAELDIEQRILMVSKADISMEEYRNSIEEERENPELYQSQYSDIIRRCGVIEESYLIYAIIPTCDLRERILEKRYQARNFTFR